MSVRKMTLLGVMCIMLITISCSTSGTVWDDSIPPEESAKVWFLYFSPKTYNGIDVDTKKFYMATLPAGESTFSGDINWSSTNGNVTYRYNQQDVVFSCNLEGGEEYTAAVSREYIEEIKDYVWGIGLYKEIKVFVGNKPPQERLIVFIPFHSPEKTRIILE